MPKSYQRGGQPFSRYFGLWLWKLVHLLNLVCSSQWCVLFRVFDQTVAEQLYRDKGLFAQQFLCRERESAAEFSVVYIILLLWDWWRRGPNEFLIFEKCTHVHLPSAKRTPTEWIKFAFLVSIVFFFSRFNSPQNKNIYLSAALFP